MRGKEENRNWVAYIAASSGVFSAGRLPKCDQNVFSRHSLPSYEGNGPFALVVLADMTMRSASCIVICEALTWHSSTATHAMSSLRQGRSAARGGELKRDLTVPKNQIVIHTYLSSRSLLHLETEKKA